MQVVSFDTEKSFERWLKEHYKDSEGIWVQIFKKGSGQETITYAQALDVALAYGWIDSQKKSFDAESYLQKFTPRRLKSIWSKVNREHVARLTSEGRMRPAGKAQVRMAQEDGRWDQAYDSAKTMKVPDDFLAQLKKDKKAYAFFKTLSKANVYAITWRLQTAKKPETREKRMKIILDMLREGRSFH